MTKRMQKCKDCDMPMFPVYTPCTCPFCGYDCADGELYPHCISCNIIFDRGCAHSECVYNAAIMTGFRVNGNQHKGMLVFDSTAKADEFQRDVYTKKVQVDFECSCSGNSYTCAKATTNKQPCNYK